MCATEEGEALVDERLTYEPHLLYTRNLDLVRQISALLEQRLAGRSIRRIGWRVEALPRAIGIAIDAAIGPDEWVAIDDDIADMERAKDPDEIELIRTSIACNLAAYGAAELEIAPRVSELAVLQAGQRSAILRAGEQVFHSGDYRAGEFGGFARPVPIHEGDLYIIDAWTEYRSYWSDMARTFAITTATPLQREVYDHIANILRDVGSQLKPGVHGTDIWKWVDRPNSRASHVPGDGPGPPCRAWGRPARARIAGPEPGPRRGAAAGRCRLGRAGSVCSRIAAGLPA